ncbi:MAG: ATP-binding cassette domain-containing protein [Bacillaceae bacterium]|nr:ATP-binding cassette domain-containing protein [Bacillaceae bacterium]
MGVFRDLWWYFRQEKRSYLTGIFLLFVVALLELFPPYVVGVIVDEIRMNTLTVRELMIWSVLLLLTGIAMYVIRYMWRIMIFGSAVRLGKQLRDRLYRHFTRMSPEFFHKRRTGDLMAHATNDIQAIQATAGEGVLTLVDSITVGSLVIFTMAFFINWELTLLALLPMPIMAWATSYYGSLLHKYFHKAQEAFSRLNDKVQENITGMRVIKAFGQEEAEKKSFEDLSSDVVDKNIKVAKVDALFDPTITLIVGISFFIAVAFGAGYVVREELTIGQLTQFTIYLGRLIWPMLAFGWLFNIVERGRASYDRVNTLLHVRPTVQERDGAVSQVAGGDIHFAIHTFSYPEQKEKALEQIEVDVRKGQTLGIVGKTGSGKTTLFRLLMREFDVKDGDIQIGGVSIRDYTLDALRSAVGYVPQDHFLFSMSVKDNIAFGKPDASMEEIEQAARLAAIHDDILQFKDGYDTVVGERGVTLSGGQKQRISIARALLMNPEILILDDSLSAVDASTEKGILKHLRENRRNKTTLISAHRMSAVEHADLIIVLDQGRIIERGTHKQLMAARGWYASMYERQQLEEQVARGGDASWS